MVSAGSHDRPELGLSVLSGVRVVDFTQALSGPYATLMLADLGADVIKVENPVGGDDSRQWGPPFLGEDAAYFMSVNRNKRSVALDLKVPRDREAAVNLAVGADVVVENWRPGTADRLGLGAAALRARNERLVYCSISGYGQESGTRAGYDQILQGTAGLMSMTGPAGEPTKSGIPIGDIAPGLFAVIAVVSALYEREGTGKGRTVDVSMQDSLVSMLTYQAARFLHTGVVLPSAHNGHPSICPYGMFEAADGHLNICVGNDQQFRRMCVALARPDLADDPLYATNASRVEHASRLLTDLGATLAGMTVESAVAVLEEHGVPAGPVLDLGQVLDDPLTAKRDMVLTFDRDDVTGVRAVNTPWKLDGVAPAVRRAPPRLGEHNVELIDGRDGPGHTA